MKSLRTVLLLAIFGTAAHATDYQDLQRSCFERANLGYGKYWLIECFEEIFNADPVHLKVATIAPGAGTLAIGPEWEMIPRINRTEMVFSATALVSDDTSWLVRAQAVVAVPKVRGTEHLFLSHRNGLGGIGSTLERDAELDSKSSITFRADLLDAKQQWFYGLGPGTSLANNTEYSQKQFDLRASYNNPLTSWGDFGLTTEFLRPRIGAPNGGTAITQEFNSATAPGLFATDDFLRVEPYLVFKVPPHRSPSTLARIGYTFYHDIGNDRFSFQRLTASTITTLPLSVPVHVGSATAIRRGGGFTEWVCPASRSGDHCSLGTLTLVGRTDMTFDAAGNVSPFFLDPTLGGMDIHGSDTLRGFSDYRFRAPNRVFLQAEYRHPIWSIFGLLAFYDVGKVGFQPSNLALTQLRHDIGFGMYISVANHQIAQLYVGFGTGEPIQLRPRFSGLL